MEREENFESVAPAWGYFIATIAALGALWCVILASAVDWQVAHAFLPAAGVWATLAGVSAVRAPRSTPTVRADAFVLVGLLLAGLAAMLIPWVVVDAETVRQDPGPLIFRNVLTALFAGLIALFAILAASPCGRRPLRRTAGDVVSSERARPQAQSENNEVNAAAPRQSYEGLSDASASISLGGEVPPAVVAASQLAEREVAIENRRESPSVGSGPLNGIGQQYETAEAVQDKRPGDASITSTARERILLSLYVLASFLLGTLLGFSARRNR